MWDSILPAENRLQAGTLLNKSGFGPGITGKPQLVDDTFSTCSNDEPPYVGFPRKHLPLEGASR